MVCLREFAIDLPSLFVLPVWEYAVVVLLQTSLHFIVLVEFYERDAFMLAGVFVGDKTDLFRRDLGKVGFDLFFGCCVGEVADEDDEAILLACCDISGDNMQLKSALRST